jgi:ubiquinone biosynthesis protein COQ4
MTLEIPPAPLRPRARWRRALAEVRALIENPEQTERAVHLAYALGMPEFERNFQRFAASESGRALLAARPSLLAALSDRDALARLPEGSLGRAYLAYLEANGFAPDGLIVLQRRVQSHWEREEGAPPLDPLRAWFRERTLLAHDLFHVLTDYGTDELGEATLLAFTLAQLGGRSQALLTAGAALKVWRALGWRWLVYDFRAFRRGRRCAWLPALPWEELLPLRLDTVRRLAGVADACTVHPGGLLRGSPEAHAWATT